MARMIWNVALVGVVCASVAVGATFTVQIEPATAQVAPGGSVNYQIKGVVSDDGNGGLAIFGVDVLTDTGLAQPQASAGASMGSFVKPGGITNPAGYGGTVSGDDLLQIGGGQNTIGNDGVSPHPAYPSGVVVGSVALGTEIVLAEGTITAPTTPGTYTASLANPFASVLVADQGTFYMVAAATASVGVSGSLQIDVSDVAALVSSEPVADGTLPKKQNNCILLTFDTPITVNAGESLLIAEYGGGADVSASFVYSVEPDGVTLKAAENGEVLTNQTWYQVSEGSISVAPFTLDVCTLIGDADGNGQVLAGDLGKIWSMNAELGACLREDIDGNGQVLAGDLGVTWSHNAETMPAK